VKGAYVYLFLSQSESLNLMQRHSTNLGEGYNCCDLCTVNRVAYELFVSLEADFCLIKFSFIYYNSDSCLKLTALITLGFTLINHIWTLGL